ncbi:MAG TPA: 50S ribosomal protein L11 methyltransferase [Nitrososphaera sp.]|nr:50S ribosomal protein L11 methyltransferase [Nitrososphaera sp.]
MFKSIKTFDYANMPHLRSSEGVSLLRRHVSNWPAVLMVYKCLKKSVDAKFRDGKIITVSRSEYNAFYEYLYRIHLSNSGFSFQDAGENNLVATPDGLELLAPRSFSLVFDELYIMRIYGRPDLTSKVVVDVGAAIGDTALYFGKLGAAPVFAFEMDKVRCDLARANIARNNMQDRITLIEEPATADKINSLQYDFIKIDCEGCEYELLPNLELDGASELVMEYHKSPDPLLKILREKGFDAALNKEIISAKRLRN